MSDLQEARDWEVELHEAGVNCADKKLGALLLDASLEVSRLKTRMEELESDYQIALEALEHTRSVLEHHDDLESQLRRVTEERDELANSNRLNAEALMEAEDRIDQLKAALREIADEVNLPINHPGMSERTAKIYDIARSALSNPTEGTE